MSEAFSKPEDVSQLELSELQSGRAPNDIAAASHNLKNLLMIIGVRAETLVDSVQSDPTSENLARQICETVAQASAAIDDLLNACNKKTGSAC